MKFLLIPIVLFILNSESCSKDDLPKGLPTCIKKEIKKAAEAEVQNPPLQLYQYDYQDEKVYLMTSPCCDQFDYIYNSDCEKICAPFGGITGKGDNQCPEFQEKATNRTLIWKDERNY